MIRIFSALSTAAASARLFLTFPRRILFGTPIKSIICIAMNSLKPVNISCVWSFCLYRAQRFWLSSLSRGLIGHGSTGAAPHKQCILRSSVLPPCLASYYTESRSHESRILPNSRPDHPPRRSPGPHGGRDGHALPPRHSRPRRLRLADDGVHQLRRHHAQREKNSALSLFPGRRTPHHRAAFRRESRRHGRSRKNGRRPRV